MWCYCVRECLGAGLEALPRDVEAELLVAMLRAMEQMLQAELSRNLWLEQAELWAVMLRAMELTLQAELSREPWMEQAELWAAKPLTTALTSGREPGHRGRADGLGPSALPRDVEAELSAAMLRAMEQMLQAEPFQNPWMERAELWAAMSPTTALTSGRQRGHQGRADGLSPSALEALPRDVEAEPSVAMRPAMELTLQAELSRAPWLEQAGLWAVMLPTMELMLLA